MLPELFASSSVDRPFPGSFQGSRGIAARLESVSSHITGIAAAGLVEIVLGEILVQRHADERTAIRGKCISFFEVDKVGFK